MTWQGAALLLPFVLLWGFLAPMNTFFIGSGLVWALPGAFVCWRKASRKGLNPTGAVLQGALYSVANISIWVYFVKRLDGAQFSQGAIRAFYIALFVNWLLVSVYVSAMWAFVMNPGFHLI